MRNTAATLGTLAAAALLCLTVPQSAFAATGHLTVGQKTWTDPSGCYEGDIWPLNVDNQTNQRAYVYEKPGCRGAAIEILPPGEANDTEVGSSVFIR